MNEKEIRNDFDKALSSVECGEMLSAPLGWGFYTEDLVELARLHKAGKHQKKIEELLTDCNFHTECSAFRCGNYAIF